MSNSKIDPKNYKFGLNEVWEKTSNLTHTIEYPVSRQDKRILHILARDYDDRSIEEFIKFSLAWYLEMRNGDKWFKSKVERLGLDFDFNEYEKAFDEAGYADEVYANTKPKKINLSLSTEMLREFEFVSNYLRFPGSSKTMIVSRAIFRTASLYNEKVGENYYMSRFL